MATLKRGSEAASSLVIKVVVIVGVIILGVVLFNQYGGAAKTITEPLFVTVEEPARPDLEAVVSCSLGKTEFVSNAQGELLMVQKSKLALAAKNSGEVDAQVTKGQIPIEYEVAGDVSELNSRGVAAAGTYSGGKLRSDPTQCWSRGRLAAGELCQFELLDSRGYSINDNAPRGEYSLKVDEQTNPYIPPPGKILEEGGRELNRDSNECEGAVLADCFETVPSGLTGKFYCSEKCWDSRSDLTISPAVGDNCGGCNNPEEGAEAFIAGKSCGSSCCFCPAGTLDNREDSGFPFFSQIKQGEKCGRILPDLSPKITKVENGKVEGSVVNAGTLFAPKSQVCVYQGRVGSSQFELLGTLDLKGQLGAYGYSKIPHEEKFEFKSNKVVKFGFVTKVKADCDNAISELDETNNEALFGIQQAPLPDLHVALPTSINNQRLIVTSYLAGTSSTFTVCLNVKKPDAKTIIYEERVKFNGINQGEQKNFIFKRFLPAGSKASALVDCRYDVWEGPDGEINNRAESTLS